MDDEFTNCPHCDFNYMVVWSNDGWGPPEYCPRCGEELNYGQTTD